MKTQQFERSVFGGQANNKNGESDPVCVKLGKLFEVQSQMAK